MATDTITKKQIGFTLDVFKGVPPGKAYMQHYQVKTMGAADACASRLLKNDRIKTYMAELRKPEVDDTIMSVKERKQRLSQFGREDITNDKGTLIRHGNILAIAELSKLGGDYAAQKVDITEGLTELLGQLRGKAVPQITQGEKGEETDGS